MPMKAEALHDAQALLDAANAALLQLKLDFEHGLREKDEGNKNIRWVHLSSLISAHLKTIWIALNFNQITHLKLQHHDRMVSQIRYGSRRSWRTQHFRLVSFFAFLLVLHSAQRAFATPHFGWTPHVNYTMRMLPAYCCGRADCWVSTKVAK